MEVDLAVSALCQQKAGSAEVQRLMQGPYGPQSGRQLSAISDCWLGFAVDPQTGTLTLFSRPELKRGHPLNLSISISGGMETNKDSLSSGERNGTSLNLIIN